MGFRAHAFLPVWKERRKNCIRVSLAGSAELPFEKIFYLRPEGDTDCQAEEDRLQEVCRDKDILSKGNMQDTKPSQKICWILQKDKWQMLEENGMPDFLQFQEEQMLLLT